jgi:alkylation response protein AidB-like acyl-CoA dehydrogenase
MAALTEEQSMLKDQASAWASEQAPVNKFREMRDSQVAEAFVPATWQTMVEMGWTGILVPEQYGGSDLGYLTFGSLARARFCSQAMAIRSSSCCPELSMARRS